MVIHPGLSVQSGLPAAVEKGSMRGVSYAQLGWDPCADPADAGFVLQAGVVVCHLGRVAVTSACTQAEPGLAGAVIEARGGGFLQRLSR